MGAEEKNSLVRINKKMNLGKVEVEEGLQNLYINIIKKINLMDVYNYLEAITVTKKELLELMGITSRNYEYIVPVISKLTESKQMSIGTKKIYGSVFSVISDNNTYQIFVNSAFKDLLFTKTDLMLLKKIKQYKNLPLTNSEMDYWSSKLKDKKKFLMLLNQKNFSRLRGKSNKIIYAMLSEFKGSKVSEGEHKGEKYKKITYSEFKEALLLDETYRNNNVMKILYTAQREISEKTELEITGVETFPTGKGKKKQYLIIYFKEKIDNKAVNDELEKEIENNIQSLELEILDKNEFDDSEEFKKLKELTRQKIKNNFELRAQIAPITTMNKLLEFIEKNNLEVNRTLIDIEKDFDILD